MPDETILLRAKAREAIRSGKLPSRHSDRMFGTPGSGRSCVVCGKPLTRDEMEVELWFTRHDYGAPEVDQYHLHHQCYTAWEFARTNGEGTSI
jgi:hypothetical protein